MFLRGELLRPQLPDDAHVFEETRLLNLCARIGNRLRWRRRPRQPARANGFIDVLYLLEKGIEGFQGRPVFKARIDPPAPWAVNERIIAKSLTDITTRKSASVRRSACESFRLMQQSEARFQHYHLTGSSWSDLVGLSCTPDIHEHPLV